MGTEPPATTPPEAIARHAGRAGAGRPQTVAETIKGWMVEMNLKPGDRLPGEPDLIRHFGAAKGTVREAIKLLEAQGLVRSRTGPKGGVFVHRVAESRAQSLLGNYFFFHDLGIDDIYQLRRALEPELAASLAGRLDPIDLALLENAMTRYENPPTTLEEGAEQRIAELEFHEILAGLSPNPLLAFQCRFLISLLKNLTVCRKIYRRRIPEFRKQGRGFQMRLIAALRDGEAETAREIMASHMEAAQKVMEEQQATLPRNFLRD